MQFHRGRLIDHVHLRVADVEASKRFYRAVFVSLGLPDVLVEGPGYLHADELYVDKADAAVSRVHLAFQAKDRATRAYHPGYYAAFVLDPDGNNIEAVFHGPATRSAPSVVVQPT